ncbi:aminotransferase class V-fold PLP-dependent enzyme [Spirosoma flavus]
MNSAGASLMPQPVVAAMQDYLQQEAQLGGYEVERLRTSQITRFYDETARLLNTQPGNIAYAYSATDACIQVLSAIPFRAGDTILTTTNDYVSNQLAFLSMQQRLGIRLLRINDLPNGDLDLTHLEELIWTHRPVLVAITHIPTNSGIVLPAEAVGKLCQQYGVWYLLDAAQSAGQLPLDVTRLQPDFLVATGRKFLRGPRNTGFLYVSDKALEAKLSPLFVDRRGATWTGPDTFTLQTNARRFEPQEISLLSVGLAEAIGYVNQVGIEAIAAQNQRLMHRLRTGLEKLDGLTMMDWGSQQSNILTFHTAHQPLPDLEASLRRRRVVFTVQYPNFALIDFQRKGVDWVIRLSPHYFNTLDEIDEVVDLIAHFLR